MKTKKLIKILRRANYWRRGWELEMPNPKVFWEAIDEACILLDNLNKYEELLTSMTQTKNALVKDLKKTDEALNRACEKLKEVNKEKNFLEDLNIAWVWELQFANLQIEHYKSILDEVETLLDKWIKPHLVKQVINNWKERAVIDISIHTDLLFKK